MMKHKILLFILLISSFLSLSAQQMPIIAYMGVPDWQTKDEHFRNLAECGFNVSIYPYANLDLLVKACRYAEKYGVKVLATCPEMTSDPRKAALTLKDEKGFFGYSIQDEPSVPDILLRQKEIERLREHDSTHCFYINLLPFYKDEWFYPVAKAKSYEDYLRTASATSCQQLSFDFYPVTKDGIRPTWYDNLEKVRKESMRSKKPFWAFVLSVPHADYPQPTAASLRLQAYSDLAYGAQAIQYFTYWTPGKNEGYDYHDAPIARDGSKTPTYALVQAMNRELHALSPLFYGAEVVSVRHLKVIPEGTSALTVAPANLSSLKIKGKEGAIVSQLRKDNKLYMAIVNKSLTDPMKVTIKTRNDKPRHVTKQLKEEQLDSQYTVDEGDILIVRLK